MRHGFRCHAFYRGQTPIEGMPDTLPISKPNMLFQKKE
jgi:hypothetical protein